MLQFPDHLIFLPDFRQMQLSTKISAKKNLFALKIEQNVMIHTEILDPALYFPGTRAYLM